MKDQFQPVILSGDAEGVDNPPTIGSVWNGGKWGVGGCPSCLKREGYTRSYAYRVGHRMTAVTMAHGLSFDPVFLFLKYEGY